LVSAIAYACGLATVPRTEGNDRGISYQLVMLCNVGAPCRMPFLAQLPSTNSHSPPVAFHSPSLIGPVSALWKSSLGKKIIARVKNISYLPQSLRIYLQPTIVWTLVSSCIPILWPNSGSPWDTWIVSSGMARRYTSVHTSPRVYCHA